MGSEEWEGDLVASEEGPHRDCSRSDEGGGVLVRRSTTAFSITHLPPLPAHLPPSYLPHAASVHRADVPRKPGASSSPEELPERMGDRLGS